MINYWRYLKQDPWYCIRDTVVITVIVLSGAVTLVGSIYLMIQGSCG